MVGYAISQYWSVSRSLASKIRVAAMVAQPMLATARMTPSRFLRDSRMWMAARAITGSRQYLWCGGRDIVRVRDRVKARVRVRVGAKVRVRVRGSCGDGKKAKCIDK